MTACGSLVHYLSSADPKHFQPANISFGLLSDGSDELKKKIRDRKERHRIQVEQALESMDAWIRSIAEP
jgi:methylenetetrahydrofolate--tRNA-(uracil-5-)-methyltransferase